MGAYPSSPAPAGKPRNGGLATNDPTILLSSESTQNDSYVTAEEISVTYSPSVCSSQIENNDSVDTKQEKVVSSSSPSASHSNSMPPENEVSSPSVECHTSTIAYSGVATHFIPADEKLPNQAFPKDSSFIFKNSLEECPGLNVNPLKSLPSINSGSSKSQITGQFKSNSGTTLSISPQWNSHVTIPPSYPSTMICSTTELSSMVGEAMNCGVYKISGKSMLPVAYALLPVWKTLAESYDESYDSLSVVFENVMFQNLIEVESMAKDNLCAVVSTLSGYFELSVNNKRLITTGSIRVLSTQTTTSQASVNHNAVGVSNTHASITEHTPTATTLTKEDSALKSSLKSSSAHTFPDSVRGTPFTMVLEQQDIYKELSLKGHQVEESFQVLHHSSDLLLNECELSSNFTEHPSMVSLIDASVQMGVLQNTSSSTDSVLCPSQIESFLINPQATKQEKITALYYNSTTDTYTTTSGCFSLTGLQFVTHNRAHPHALQPKIERYMFQPYFQYILDTSDPTSFEVKTLMDMVVENTYSKEVSVLHVLSCGSRDSVESELITQVSKFAQSSSTINVRQDVISVSDLLPTIEAPCDESIDLIVAVDIGNNSAIKALLCNKHSPLLNRLAPGGFVLLKEPLSSIANSPQKWLSGDLRSSDLHCVSRRHYSNTETPTNSESVLLLYHHVPHDVVLDSNFTVVEISAKEKSLPWIAKLKKLLKLKGGPRRIYCVSELEQECPSGILGLINCLRLESCGVRLRCVYLTDSKLNKSEFYSSSTWRHIQEGDMVMNVIKNNQIGSYRHLPLRVAVDELKMEKEACFDSTDKANVPVVPQRIHNSSPPFPLPRSLGSQFYCDSNKSYIITGGLGGFGLELASWLTKCGAKKLILTSRSGVKLAYQARKISTLRADGVDVTVSNLDVSQQDEANALITLAVNELEDTKITQQIGGIFHLAVVLRDCKFESQTAKRFQSVLLPKFIGALNLDRALDNLSTFGHNVKDTMFVVFSSASCGFGHATQTSYGFANSSMERLCEERQKRGVHGLAIQWGAIGDVGVLHNMMGGRDVESIGGTRSQPLSSCLKSLETILSLPTPSPPVVSCYVPSLSSDQISGVSNIALSKKLNDKSRGSPSSLESRSIKESTSVDVHTGVPAVPSDCSVSTVSTCDSQSDLVNVHGRPDE